MNSINLLGKVLGVTGIIGGGALLATGVDNVEASDADAMSTRSMMSLIEGQTANTASKHGVKIDFSSVEPLIDQHQAVTNDWGTAGLATAIAGGSALIAGTVGVLAHGRLGAIARIVGAAATVTAGVSAGIGLSKYLASNDTATAAIQEMHRAEDDAYDKAPASASDPTVDHVARTIQTALEPIGEAAMASVTGTAAPKHTTNTESTKPLDPQIRKVVAEFDKNGDGKLNPGEYHQLDSIVSDFLDH